MSILRKLLMENSDYISNMDEAGMKRNEQEAPLQAASTGLTPYGDGHSSLRDALSQSRPPSTSREINPPTEAIDSPYREETLQATQNLQQCMEPETLPSTSDGHYEAEQLNLTWPL